MNPRAPRGDLSSVFAPTREGTAINRFIPVDVTARFSSLVVDSFPRPITARDTTLVSTRTFSFFPNASPNAATTTTDSRARPQETDNAYQLKADVPGVKKEEITLEVDGNVIRIGTKRESKESEEEESPDKRWHRSERREYSEFQQRALRMPENTDFSSLQATYDNGTLCLDVKKKHDSKDQKKKSAIK